MIILFWFFFSSRRRHTRWTGDWSSDVCSSDLEPLLRQALTDATVRIAEDRAAVERAFSGRLRYDVVVIDLTWMDYAVEYSFDGLDVLDMLRRTRRQTPVIFAAQGHGPERDHLDEAIEQPEVVGVYRKATGPQPLVEAIDIAVRG